ncbi:MAG: hypothetical protein LT106_21910 [Burkholderiaceae bacterium]|nr:hypothetical protein [Burkholderiaceae bacterium]
MSEALGAAQPGPRAATPLPLRTRFGALSPAARTLECVRWVCARSGCGVRGEFAGREDGGDESGSFARFLQISGGSSINVSEIVRI